MDARPPVFVNHGAAGKPVPLHGAVPSSTSGALLPSQNVAGTTVHRSVTPAADETSEACRERHRRQTFERLLRAARAQMLNKGLAEVTVQTITDAADVGKGTFFSYFRSKEHVFAPLHEIQRRGAMRTAERVRAGERSVEEGLTELLTWIMCPQGGAWLTYHSNLVQVLALHPEVRRGFSEQLHAGSTATGALMAAGQQRAITRTDIEAADLGTMTQMFLAGMQVLQWIHATPPTPESIGALMKTYCQLLTPVADAPLDPACTPRRSRQSPRKPSVPTKRRMVRDKHASATASGGRRKSSA